MQAGRSPHDSWKRTRQQHVAYDLLALQTMQLCERHGIAENALRSASVTAQNK